MDMNTPCPACGAMLTLSSESDRTTCPFCGNTFQVDQTSVTPTMRVVKPDEMTPEPLPVQSAETESVVPEPAMPPAPQPASFDPLPPSSPYSGGALPQPASRRNLTWIIFAVLVTLLVCAAFACLVGAAVLRNIRFQ